MRTGDVRSREAAYDAGMAIESSALAALSNELATTVERVAAGVVAVEGRSRIGSSGFFVRPNLILTADHALESDEIEVVHPDGETETVTIAGRDPSTDLALLRSQRAGVPLAFATNDPLRVGTLVVAVARDDDGDVAATMGVLSAVGAAWRTWQGGQIDRFVRPDLGLYPRFSGSPLADAAGRIIGLNTLGLSRRQALTVPLATIDRVIDALLAGGGRLPRGYLGVALQAVDGGAIVLGVEPSGPAAKAGVIVGDVIVGIAGTTVADADDVHAQLGSDLVGSTVALALRRGGAAHTVQVTIGDRADHER
jgi:S1-C subfamily serine protease